MSRATNARRGAGTIRWSFVAWAAALMLAFWVGGAFLGVARHLENQRLVQTRLATLSQDATERLQHLFGLYEYGLRAARGVVISDKGDGVSPAVFARYAESRDLATEFPGARGFGFIARIAPANEKVFIARMRAEGSPNFAVREFTPNPGEKFIITTVQPAQVNRLGPGLDIASEPTRREAAERSMRSGRAALSGPITLQSTQRVNHSMLMLLPVYRGAQNQPAGQRERDLVGWVYAPLYTDDILASFDQHDQEYGFKLTDVTDPAHPTRFFESLPTIRTGPLSHSSTFDTFGRHWRLEIDARPGFVPSMGLPDALDITLVTGIVGTLLALLAMVALSLQARRHRSMAQRERLAAIVESSHDAVIGTTVEGRITEWNRSAGEIFGYPADEAIGAMLSDLIVPQRKLHESATMRKSVASGGEVAMLQTVRRHRGGAGLDVELSASPIYGGHRKRRQVVGIALTIRDIRERKQAEKRILELNATLEQQVLDRTAQLQAASSLQQAILAHAGYAIVATDPNGTITLFNPAAEAMLGYTAADMVGRASPTLFHDSDELAARAAWLREELGRPVKANFETLIAKVDGQTDVNEWLYVTREGKPIPVLLNVSALDRDDGELLGYLSIAVDLRERKKREATLAANERKLRGLFELSPLGIALTDEAGQLVEFNESFRLLTGFAEHDLRVHDYRQITPPEYALQEQELMATVARTGRYGPYEKHFLREDGERIPVRLNGVSFRIGEKLFLWSIVEDITLQRTTEAAMVDAVAAAEAASAAKSHFLANMSHEIRTPMNAILGMLQLLQRTGLDLRQEDYRGKTEIAARTLLAILNDILDFSKIEAGRQTLETSAFDVELLFREVGVILGANVGEKDIELAFDIDEHMPGELIGDSLRLRQVLINLAGNAIKFTQYGEVVIGARITARGDNTVTLAFDVRDTGIGIDKDKIGAIFEGFSQAEASTSRRFGGTGLGLAISQRLVRLMGGELGVESERGRGSRFFFTVDLALPESNGRPTQALPPTPARLQDLRALVIDDNASARQIITEMALSLGWQTDLASSGEEALERVEQALAQSRPYEVILVDWKMPGLDGWDTSRKIRELPHEQVPLIVMVTAHGREVLAERTIREGGVLDGFLTKPITAAMLLDAVADACAHHASDAADAPTGTSSAGTISPSTPRLQGMHLLVVEDNLTNQQVVTELLHAEGAKVDVAGGGAEALGLLHEAHKSYDAVLMDIQMPDMDGYAATRQIRMHPHLQQLPIIAMTANVLPSDRQACVDAGMNDHIGKPFDLDHLVGRLRQWTGRSTDAGATTSPGAPETTVASTQPAPLIMDRRGALARMGGDQRIYDAALVAFPGAARQLMGALVESIARHARADALRHLHTLRGLAGTVGAQQLAAITATQEQAVRARDESEWEQAIAPEHLISALQKTQPAADAILSEATPDSLQPDRAITREQLEELAALLDASNLRSLELYADLAPGMARAYAPAHQRIEAALAELDFDAALAACGGLLFSEWNIP